MVIWHAQRKRAVGGRKYKKNRDKRKRELGRHAAHTKVSEKPKVKKIRTKGAGEKLRAFKSSMVNVLDPSSKKCKNVKISRVLENPSNRHFARMGILTKGAIIETELGKAKVTSKPGQTGTIDAVLIK